LKTVGVVAALAAEARALGRAREHRAERASFGNLAFLSDGSMVAVSGIGAQAAALAARALVDAGVAGLMTFGLAGGLDPTLTAGSIVLPTEVLSRDNARRYPTSAPWRERLAHILEAQRRIVRGPLLTSASAIGSPAEKQTAWRETGAVAVDMESAAVAAMAAEHDLPFISVRVVIDTAHDVVPAAVVRASSEGRVLIGGLVAGLAAAPAELLDLWRLAKRYRSAMRALRLVARCGSLAPSETDLS
jgi:adenosylhomocysteine nucleosidase